MMTSSDILYRYEYSYYSSYAWGTLSAAKQLIVSCDSELTKEDILVNADIFYELSVR